ncbi:MAG: DUF3592 domain-containing protein [Anaerolineae bacterium]
MTQPSDFFLLDPENEAFATGTSSTLPAGGQGCLLLFLSIFVVAGLLITYDIVRRWAHVVILNVSHTETQGQLVERWIESDEGATYYVMYRFVANDLAYTVEEAVAEATYHSVEEGQLLTVRYALSDPNIATIQPGRIGGLLALTGFGLVWDGLVFSFSWLLLREVLKRRKLARRGQRIAGEIVRCSGERDSDGDFALEVRFGFRSPHTGAWIEGKDSQTRKDLEGKALPSPGTPVHVLYLDEKTYLML